MVTLQLVDHSLAGPFGQELLLDLQHLLVGLRVHLRILRIDVHERVKDDPRRRQSREPLVVGGNDVPRRVLGARGAQHVLVRMLVVIPTLAFQRVGDVEFRFRAILADLLEGSGG